MIEVIDTHCHLDRLDLSQQTLDEVLTRTRKAGVTRLVSICVDLSEAHTIQSFSERYPFVFHSIGVHPSDVPDAEVETDEIVAWASHPKCVAIGETGLDYHYNSPESFMRQQASFIQHIQIAKQLHKPLVVHTRDAKQETIRILRSEQAEVCGGILHCFTEDWEMAKQALDLGFYISFSGIVTFKNAKMVQEVAKRVPLDRLLIETDAPYLTPHPYRGKANYPYHVLEVARYLADLREMPLSELAKCTYANSLRVFKDQWIEKC